MLAQRLHLYMFFCETFLLDVALENILQMIKLNVLLIFFSNVHIRNKKFKIFFFEHSENIQNLEKSC